MRIFIKRYGYELSNTTMHKYMNKELNLCAVIMHSKPGYNTGKKNKIFDNLLNQNFTVDCKNKVWCTDFTYMRSQMENSDKTVQLLICMTGQLSLR